MNTDATRRVFVGMSPPIALAEELARRATGVLDADAWRIYAPADIHLTLCFLGEVAAERVEPLATGLARALAEHPISALVVSGTGAFPDTGKVRALWAGITGSAAALERLAEIQRRTGAAIRACALAWDERPVFAPHLTLARPRGNVAMPEAFRRLALDCAWTPTEVSLFESTGGAGERYPRRPVARLTSS